MAIEIGALIVSLRSESAQFAAEMDHARKTMKGAGEQATASQKQIAKLAADGFGAVLPISFQVENALERFIEKALKAQGAMALLGKATIALGVGFGAFKLGERLGEFAALGTTADKYAENLKKATDEQRKFSDTMERQRNVMRGLAKELADLRGDQAGALDSTFKAREAQIIKELGGASPAAKQALALLGQVRLEAEKKALAEQRTLRDEADQKLLDQMLKERDEQAKRWQEETQVLASELQRRLKLRQDFEAQFGQGGLPGDGATGGLRAARELREQLAKEARDLAFAEREGLLSPRDATAERESIRTRALEEARRLKQEFAGLPVVLEAIDKAVEGVQFGNFGQEIAKARTEIQSLAPTLDSLKDAQGRFAQQLATMPAAVDPASQAVRALTQDYLNATNAIYALIAAQNALVAAEASRAALPNTGAQFVDEFVE